MSKKLIRFFLSAVVVAASVGAFAAREEHTFDVFVTIPTQAFYVIP